MDLKALKKPLLLELAKNLGLDVLDQTRKPAIIAAIEALQADDDELSECLELIAEREKSEREAEQRNDKRLEKTLELKRLELEMLKARNESGESIAPSVGEPKSVRMKDLMQPYRKGEDIGLFFVNFERTREKAGFIRATWPQCLLTLLSGEAANVIARLCKEDSDNYDKVKSSLLKKYRMSAEAFRQKFRNAEKQRDESYPDFAYKLMANLGEWLKEAKAYDGSEKMMQCFGLEQFYRRLPEDIRHWVQDRQDVTTVSKAADLAEEFVSRRALDRKESPKKEYQNRKASGERGQLFKVKEQARSVESSERGAGIKEKAPEAEERQKKAFEKRRAPVCYNCQKPGHIAAVCKNPKVVCLSVDSNEENLKLLEPYIRDLVVNGKPCRVLRDSAATMDVVHPSYVEPGQFTGECAWIKQAVEANSVCLPIANISIEGPFGVLHTEAAVSASLPMQYPYLFSNRSDQLLRQKDLVFGEGTVYALTRSKARKIAAKAMPLEASSSIGTVEIEPPDASGEVLATATEEVNILGRPESSKNCMELKEAYGELLITPASDSLQRLLGVDRSSLIAEQRADSTLQNLRCREEEGVAKKNVLFQERSGVLYRRYHDRRGVQFDQLVVPKRYRRDLLHLVHGSSWSGHLGLRKTKDRLLQEFYWPGCFREVENFVKTCDTCQRVGKPGDKVKAPMKLVPVITEPFRRLVIDTVGPLPKQGLVTVTY
ncbi:uncharacterized protein LOC144129485 [Amblyomma americanum]